MNDTELSNLLALERRAIEILVEGQVGRLGSGIRLLQSRLEFLLVGIAGIREDDIELVVLFRVRASPDRICGYSSGLGAPLSGSNRMSESDLDRALWETLFGLIEDVDSNAIKTDTFSPIYWIVGWRPSFLDDG